MVKGTYHLLVYPSWCSGYWSRQHLYFMIIVDFVDIDIVGKNGMCFRVENQETKFPGLVSPEFEFV